MTGEWSFNMLRISVVTALMVLIGCASAPTDPTVSESAVPVLWEVRLYDDADEAIVELVGIEDPVYSTFRMDDPRKVVLEYEGAVGSTFVPPSPSSLSLVEQVTVSELGETAHPVTRIEFSLKSPAVFEVMEGAREFAFRVIPLAEGMEADAGVIMQPLASDEVTDEADSEPAPSDEPEMVIAPEAPDATQVSDLRVESVDGGLLVHIAADGSIRSPESFVIEDPARLVIDLPGVTSIMDVDSVELDSLYTSRARLGVHPDKLRLVFDGKGGVEAFDGRWVIPTREGLLVTFGQSESVTAAVEAAMSPLWVPAEGSTEVAEEADQGEETMYDLASDDTMDDMASDSEGEDNMVVASDTEDGTDLANEEMSDEEWMNSSDSEMASTEEPAAEEPAATGTTTIQSVAFLSEEGLDRIVISSDQPIAANSFEPDADTLILRFENAAMGSGDKVRIVPEEHGPVSLVTAFDQPDMALPEVRVVLTRQAGQTPMISREGDDLIVDFVYSADERVTEPAEVLADASDATEPAAAPEEGDDSEAVAIEDAEEVVTLVEEGDIEIEDDGAEAEDASSMDSDEALADATAEGMDEVPAALEDIGEAAASLIKGSGFKEGKQYSGELISLDFHEAQMSNILRLIAEVSGLNVIAGEEVNGTITIRLRDVPWDQALDIILMTKGLGYYRMGDVLRIAPIDILRAEEEARLMERRAREKLEDLEVRLIAVNFARAKDVKKLIADVLTARGSTVVDERTNTLIVKDIVKVLDEAEALVTTLDSPTPQVLIESKIVEANLNFSRALGVSWATVKEPNADGHTDGTDFLQWKDTWGGEDADYGDIGTFANHAFSNTGITDLATGQLNLGFALLDGHFGVDMAIQGAEKNNQAKVISSPRVVTMDNRKAIIEQGVSIPYQSIEDGTVKIEFVDAVLSLEVTPHITSNRSVIMQLKVTKDAPLADTASIIGGVSISTNHLETESLVKDGQTLVLGGIYQVNTGDNQNRVPFLHTIPVMGNLFKNKETLKEQRELLVFISPSVVDLDPLASAE